MSTISTAKVLWMAAPYFISYSLLYMIYFGMKYGGWGYWLVIPILYIIVPVLDQLLGLYTKNVDKRDELALSRARAFKGITYIWPIVEFSWVLFTLHHVTTNQLTILEFLGLALSTAQITGGLGLTIAHELMHKINSPVESSLGESLLYLVHYPHWKLEHIEGHHRNVATEKDPATARYNQSLYRYLFQAIVGGLIDSFQIEQRRLARKGCSQFSYHNRLLRFESLQLLVNYIVYVYWGTYGLLFFFTQAFFAVAMLEATDYIEHYGLLRQKYSNGKYEPPKPKHSWNSSHLITSWLLINLTRHSDHHQFGTRRYQILRHIEDFPQENINRDEYEIDLDSSDSDSYHDCEGDPDVRAYTSDGINTTNIDLDNVAPQLPYNYPAMVFISFFPPVWFKIMNPRVEAWYKKYN